MRMTIRGWAAAATMLGGMVAASGRADAGMIAFTQTTTASGSLGGVAFADAAITFTQVADPGDVTGMPPGPLVVASVTSTVQVQGLGLATFTSATTTFTYGLYAGLGRSSDARVIIAVLNPPALIGYDLGRPIGPVIGSALIDPANAFATDRGSLVLTSARAVVFRATEVPAVPEPGSLALCGVAALAGLGAWARRASDVARSGPGRGRRGPSRPAGRGEKSSPDDTIGDALRTCLHGRRWRRHPAG